jgi:imidazolonepropionase-like amidohydrolase
MKQINTNNKKLAFAKHYLLPIAYCLLPIASAAQENILPALPQQGSFAIVGGNIHVGNGKVFKGAIKVEKGKIVEVTETGTIKADKILDATGSEIYPGVIAPSTNLGLVEIGAVRATADFNEVGDVNPSIRSIVAYNTDSKIINTIRNNGILLAHVVPSGGSISGSSSIVQLDAWNYEDAVYKADNGIHYNMPSLINRPSFGGRRQGEQVDVVKLGLERIETTRKFFREAKAYHAKTYVTETNLKFEAVKGLFNRTQTFFVHCDLVKEMMMAIDFAKEFNFKLCIVGGSDSWIIADHLKQNNVAVILSEPHSLPNTNDDDVDQPYKTGVALQKAGVLFTICQDVGDGFWRQRSLPFQAGTMAAYGLTKEEALTAITLNPAKILDIQDKTGTIEVGKDANIVVSKGDLLDMKTNNVTAAFIQGREINLQSKHTQLNDRYKAKYNLK